MEFLLKLIPVILIAAAVILIFMLGYVKAPPDVAYIISGLRKHPKVLIGKAGIKIPFLERVDKLIVRQISIDIKSEGYIPTQDFIGVDVDAVAKVRVMTDPEGIQLAMKNFLNMTEEDFNRAIVDSLQGNMREIIGTITLKEICNDRKKFGDEVQSKAQTDMNALGIQIISCNIQRVTDENSLINSLGQDNMSKIQKDAAIAKAEAERDIAIAQAQAAKASNDAQVEADMHIAQKQNDLAIKQSELKVQEDTKRAEADAAYTIQQQEQQRSIETATVNAQIAKTEREAELKSKEVEVKKQSLDAEVRAAADADRYRKEQEAQAALYQRQKDAEAVRYEQEQAAEAAKKAAIEMLGKVGIPDPERRYEQYPHEFSGGMRQRVVIAIAAACRPQILICDEPTTALDVTIQAQILQLIRDLQKELGMSVIYITHDLGVVANVADRVAVMYAGQIVEYGTVQEIFYDAWHPYTWALLQALPQLGTKGESLPTVDGTPPNLFNEIHGDAFAPRNKHALAIDFVAEPPFFQVSETHAAKTWYLDPRAPKIERPHSIQNLREKMGKMGGSNLNG